MKEPRIYTVTFPSGTLFIDNSGWFKLPKRQAELVAQMIGGTIRKVSDTQLLAEKAYR